MIFTIHNRKLELHQGDITDQAVDAIVNAANDRLAGGGGVDGAIHRRGGASIMAETAAHFPTGCPTGSAVITGAGDLNSKFVIHAVGPIWNGGNAGEAELLSSAYAKCLELAAENNCASLAFPSLSTGAYRYPLDLASRIAIDTTVGFLRSNPLPNLVRFVLFDDAAMGSFAESLGEILS